MRIAGYTSLNDSQTLLEYDIKRESWFIDLSSYPVLAGTWTANNSKVLNGTGTLAGTDLSVNDWIILDYNVVKVIAITDDTTIEVDRPITVTSDTYQLITAGEEVALKTKCENEYKCLLTAYNEFLNSSDYTLTSLTVPEEKIIKAQVYRAYELYDSASADVHAINKQSGIEEVQIGKVRYKYNPESIAESTGSFTNEIASLLDAYKVELPIINLSRQYAEEGFL